MKNLSERLAATLNETSFDLEYTEVTGNGDRRPISKCGISASDFAEVCHSEGHGIVRKRARVRAPETMISQLAEELRIVLGRFIDPDSDRLGHAFPTDPHVGNPILLRMRPDGLSDFEFQSTVENFANSLVQAAAIIGVDRAEQLIQDWKRGEPIRFRTSTFVNGLTLHAQLSPREDIKIVPMPLTTAELPRLPDHHHLSGQDYLGLTVLSLAMSASPALFRPKPGGHEEIVQSHTEKDINLNVVCDALSLRANRHVVPQGLMWTEYEAAAPFALGEWTTWTLGTNSFERARWENMETNYMTGVVTLKRANDVSIASLDAGEVLHTVEALQGADGKLRIPIDRWKRSKRPSASKADRYIDLRIALETLYLKDFVNEHSGELRFRLSLFWGLASRFDSRRAARHPQNLP